ncbi:MAG: PorV/PorQ family protein [Flavobacteriales bacterium]
MKILSGTFFLVFIVLSQFHGHAQGDLAPKYSNEFLSLGIGARSLGMSNAVVASVDDVTAGYWNPAALLGVKNDLQVGLMHAEYFAGIAKYDYGAIAKRLDEKSVGAFSVIRFGVDNIPNTTELIDAQGNINYDRISYFSAADYAFILSYARELREDLGVGGNAKIVHRKIGDFARAWGFGVDASAIYTKESWKFAAVLRDATSTFNAWSFNLSPTMVDVFIATGNELPENGLELTLPRMILGTAREITFSDKFNLLAEANMVITTDGRRNTLIRTSRVSIDPFIGLQGGYKNIVFLRAGLGNIQQVTDLSGKKIYNVQPNMGLGVKIKQVSLDYAYTDIANTSVALYSHVFSLRFDLNKNPQ